MAFRDDPSRRQLLASLAAPLAQARPSRPNLLIVLSDQQHWQALGHVDRSFDTPHLDRLAREGFSFPQSSCTTPQCSPSRSSLLTGLYPSTTGVIGNIGAAGGGNLKRPTLLDTLAKAGYTTAYFGKWHLGKHPSATQGLGTHHLDAEDEEVTTECLAFLERQRGAAMPFAMVLSYLNPHEIYDFGASVASFQGSSPLPRSWHQERFTRKPAVQREFMTNDQGKEIWGRPQRHWEAYRAFYRDKVQEYDRQLGRVLQALAANQAEQSTVVLATSDHGDMDTHHKLIFKGPFLYEHMVRVPLIVRLPAPFHTTQPRTITNFPAVNVDITPTLLDLAGIPASGFEGVSLAPLLTGRGRVPRRDYVIGQYYSKQRWVNPIRMARTDRFKYNRYIRHGEELYDLRNDPNELVNLAGDAGYQRQQRELSGLLDHWMTEHRDPFASFTATDRAGNPL